MQLRILFLQLQDFFAELSLKGEVFVLNVLEGSKPALDGFGEGGDVARVLAYETRETGLEGPQESGVLKDFWNSVCLYVWVWSWFVDVTV